MVIVKRYFLFFWVSNAGFGIWIRNKGFGFNILALRLAVCSLMQLSPNLPVLDLIVSHAVYIAPGDNRILHVQSPQGFLYPFLGSDCTTFGHCVYGGQDYY